MTTEPSAAADAVGAVLNGQWQLVRLLGEGGLAAVYEAHGLQGQGRRAVKLLHPEFRARVAVTDRFYNEAKACFALRHPNIAVVEGYAIAEDGSPYIVMELLEGSSLEALLSAGRPMPPGEAGAIMVGVLRALSVAHGRGIVHRDLKPANLFLVRDAAGQWVPKVLDFGIAKVMDEAGGMGSKTRTGALLGTPGYMSPEQVKNAKGVDARTDLWAVGVVLYEMLTCRHPFEAADKLARMVAVLKDAPRSVGEWAPSLGSWDSFFRKALAKSPDERFSSAEQMADAMADLLRPLLGASGAACSTGSPHGTDPLSASAGPLPTLQNAGPTAAPAAMSAPPVRPDDHSWPLELASSAAEAFSRACAAPAGEGGTAGGPGVRPGGISATQISGDEPPGPPTHMAGSPNVRVVTAADEEPAALVWWAVLLLAIACLALGFTVGYLLGSR